MPTFQRKTLRRDLGTVRLHETLLGTTSLSLGVGGAFVVLDSAWANPDFSGQGMYERAWLRVGSADYRVGTFNAASGAWVSGQVVRTAAIASGADLEVHTKMDPALMDRYIDETISHLRVRQEVAIRTIDGLTFYTLDGAAGTGAVIRSVLNTYWFANPAGTGDRQRHDMSQEQVVFTGSGMELRIPGGLGASLQIVLDALLQMTLGAADLATVNLGQYYDEEVVLWGAAARCYDSLIQDSPGQEEGTYIRRRADAVRQWNRLAQKGAPQIDAKIGFDSPFQIRSGQVLGALDDWI